ncbi:MAG: rRNA pseudouridine synthase [Pseudoxanthomonas sp.]|nr:rRNA pseudouridine synthase [Pseudoxanthomonas sp.]
MMMTTPARRVGLARVLSKRGLCSRSQAAQWVADGRVTVDGRVVRDPEYPITGVQQQIAVQGADAQQGEHVYLMLNKPRGLVTTTRDEQGRDTVYRCLAGARLPWVAPVGRLDKASEGLLLFSNDTEWAAGVTHPERGPDKTYHVQVDAIPDAAMLEMLVQGVEVEGEHLSAKSARLLRSGSRNAWLEIVLDEGRNRQIRRLLGAFNLGVLRLLRTAIGPVALGALAKGEYRRLTPIETGLLGTPGANP